MKLKFSNKIKENRGKSLNSKAMGAIVATSLLIVVTVVASIGFQSWFTDFESGLATEVEKQSMNTQLRVDGIFGDILYLYSGDETVLSSLKIVDNLGNEMCSFSGDGVVNDTGLVGWWTFDEIINQSGNLYVKDMSGNENHGEIKQGFIGNITSISGNEIIFKSININNNENQIVSIYFKSINSYYENCFLKQGENSYLILNDNYNSISLRNFILNTTLNLELGLVEITCGDLPSLVKNKNSYVMKFDGIDDYIEINNFEKFNITKDLTMYTIFKLEDKNNNNPIFDVGLLVPYGYGFWLENSRIRTHLPINNSYLPLSLFYGNISKNKFTLGVFSYNDNLDVGNLYVNNQLIETKTNLSNKLNELKTTFPKIGAQSKNLQTGRYFKGEIDEIRIYNRILTEEEISSLYWYSIKNNQAGVNQLDISSCNLNKGETYNIVGFTNNQKVESIQLKR